MSISKLCATLPLEMGHFSERLMARTMFLNQELSAFNINVPLITRKASFKPL